MELIADTFVNLLTNGLVFITAILGGSFGLAILVFTLVTRVLMYPLTAKQLRSSRAMQNLQPKIKEIQEKHKNDRARLQREQMALFKQAGVNPVGCLGPMIIQLPIFIALFYAIRKALADTPESLVSLSSKLYDWLPIVGGEIPLNSKFLGVDMGLTPSDEGGAAIVLFPLLVGGSTYVVQKMISTQSSDARQQSMTSMMTWMMPIMLGFWTIGFPIGL
ncbi:YidC/Oxa1 family membrane protein insertase, partial [Dehalococcoidia bacterium]|nr:YidC/Oxa1 family membrane protein insertase [Dehalococcoidia bacterium]